MIAERRYQIFVSSTFRDLIEERQQVLQAVLELGHIPAGMEVFPAADDTPWEVIESVIDASDYYVVIVGGRYGSIDAEGVSYTEREYSYAEKTGKPILAFLHKDAGELPSKNVDQDPAARERLEAFRGRIAARHCKYWLSALELKSQVIVGITHLIATHPALGYVRGDRAEDPGVMAKLAKAQESHAAALARIGELEARLRELEPMAVRDIHGDETVEIGYDAPRLEGEPLRLPSTWNGLFYAVGPLLVNPLPVISTANLFRRLGYELFHGSERWAKLIETIGREPQERDFRIAESSLQSIFLQFLAWGWIERTETTSRVMTHEGVSDDRVAAYQLTERGIDKLAAARFQGPPAAR
ncbi:MAG: DUF4062 domain-containing protein [Acidobacteria bacterium]|nr:DUF4062 domain-containing protein [Acidobacteriota bacterium]